MVFRSSVESQYRWCNYFSEYIDEGLCADTQMVVAGFVKRSALDDKEFDIERAAECCENCDYRL